MTRFLARWIVLTFTLLVATFGVSVAVFREVDLRYESFVQLVAIPPLQAMFLTFATTRAPRRTSPLAAMRASLAHPLVIPVVAIDVVMLVGGWTARTPAPIALGNVAGLQPAWIGAKAAAAAFFIVRLAIGALRPRADASEPTEAARLNPPQRIGALVFAMFLFALALHPFLPWLDALPSLLLPQLPTVLQWVIVYGTLFAVTIAALLMMSAMVRPQSPLAALHLEAASAPVLLCALTAALSAFERPYLVDPWASLTTCFASLSATLATLGGIVAAVPAEASPSPRHVRSEPQ